MASCVDFELLQQLIQQFADQEQEEIAEIERRQEELLTDAELQALQDLLVEKLSLEDFLVLDETRLSFLEEEGDDLSIGDEEEDKLLLLDDEEDDFDEFVADEEDGTSEEVIFGILSTFDGEDGGGEQAPPEPEQAATVAVSDVSVDENNGFAVFTITRSGAVNNLTHVTVDTVDGTATSGVDFAAVSETLGFHAGETVKTLTVSIVNDAFVEGDETFRLVLTDATATIVDSVGIATIIDDDVVGNVSVNDVTVHEEAGVALFTVTRTGNDSTIATVEVDTVNHTATSGSDFTPVSTILTFSVGVSQQIVTVAIKDDAIVESLESFPLVLSHASGANITDNIGNGVIIDNDTRLDIRDAVATEANDLLFTITRQGVISGISTVEIQTIDGTAESSSVDFNAVGPSTITFHPGDTAQTITVEVIDDKVVEGNENFTVQLSHANSRFATGDILITDSIGIATIVNDDAQLFLDEFDGRNGVTLQGEVNNDRLGYAVANAGDFNGDGYEDLVLGAPGHESSSGKAYVVFGENASNFNDLNLLSLDGSNGFSIAGLNSSDQLGISVAGNADINGDGIADVVISAYGFNSYQGKVYVIFGKQGFSQSSVDLGTLNGSNGFSILGSKTGYYTGESVSVGDINGDGFADIIIGSTEAHSNSIDDTGAVFVVFGKTVFPTANINLSDINGSNGFRINGVGDEYDTGNAVNATGDLNGDGINDLVIGAEDASPNGKYDAGSSYVVFGSATLGLSDRLELSDLNGSNGFVIHGLNVEDDLGESVSFVGDINGDGFVDLVIGAEDVEFNGNNYAGASYVIFGGSSLALSGTLDLASLDGSNGFVINGLGAYDYTGFSVSSAGDFNGDGFSDLLIGAPRAEDLTSNNNQGKTYLVFGSDTLGASGEFQLSDLNGSNGFTLLGESRDDKAGVSVSAAGDFNGDGFDDILVGAPYAGYSGFTNTYDTGEAYIIFGNDFSNQVDILGTDGDDNLVGDINNNILIGGKGNDVLVGLGGQDVFRGGQGDDIITIPDTNFFSIDGGSGNSGDELHLSGAGIHFDLTTLPNHKVQNIEMIDMTGSGDNTLSLTALDAFALSETSHSITINGDLGDAINIIGDVWDVSSSAGFTTFSFSDTELIVAEDINANVTTSAMSVDDVTVLESDAQAVITVSRTGTTQVATVILDTVDGLATAPDDYISLLNHTISFAIGQASQTVTIHIDDDGILNEGVENFVVNLSHPSSLFFNVSLADSVGQVTIIDEDTALTIHSTTVNENAGEALFTVVRSGSSAFTTTVDFISQEGSATDGNDYVGQSGVLTFTEGQLEQIITVPIIDDFILSEGSETFTVSLSNPSADVVSFVPKATATILDNDATLGIKDVTVNETAGTAIFTITQAGSTEFTSTVVVDTIDNTAVASDDYMTNHTTLTFAVGVTEQTFTVSIIDDNVNGEGIENFRVSLSNATGATIIEDSAQGVILDDEGILNLSSLNGVDGFTIRGVSDYDYTGISIGSIGDINGDGFNDIVIGAYGVNDEQGVAYVVFGNTVVTRFDLSTLNGSNGFRIDGENLGDFAGISVNGAGDVNGDGIADVIIGAVNANGTAGSAYVVFGSATLGATGSFELASMTANDGLVFPGTLTGDSTGDAVSSAGDINGDGFDDILIGATGHDAGGGNNNGQVFVVFGSELGHSNVDLNSLNGSNGFTISGKSDFDQLGFAVDTVGDINGDGYEDFIVSSPHVRGGGGEAYVILGGEDVGQLGRIDINSLDGRNGFLMPCVAAGDYFGYSVSGLGDVNGDGFDDFAVGATRADSNGSNSGSVYILFGSSNIGTTGFLDLATLNGSNGFEVTGLNASDYLGSAVAGVGDVNGDGFDDILISANQVNANTGQSYLILGGSNIAPTGSFNLANLYGNNGYQINGINSGDHSGSALSGIGEFNGDGLEGFLVAAPNANNNTGEVYFVFGEDVNDDIDILGDEFSNSLVGDSGDNVIVAQEGDDLIISGGGADVLLGNAGEDEFLVRDGNYFKVDGGSGMDTLSLDGASIILDTRTFGQTNGIEIINLTGTGDNQLVMDRLSLLDLSDTTNRLTVLGDAGDSIIIDDIWADLGKGGGFQTFSSGQAQLIVDQNITTHIDIGIIDLSFADGRSGFVLNGVSGDDFSGTTVSQAGDINGDGIDDFLVGAFGADPNGESSGVTYVVFGDANLGSSGSLELVDLNGSNGFHINGMSIGDQSSFSISDAGDVNGDGISDILIGAFAADPHVASEGESYVVFGQVGIGASGVLELSDLNGTNGFKINGINDNDFSGRSVSSAGDVNGDGFSDVIIGAFGADPNGNYSGQSYVIFGGNSVASHGVFELSSLTGSNGFILNGTTDLDLSGRSVSSAGDINGDGIDDIIIGAYRADANGIDAGESYVIFGRTGIGSSGIVELASLNGNNGFVLNGVDNYDYSGISVSNAGDVNGDGIEDLMVGARLASPNGIYSGESYVIFGQATIGSGGSIELANLDGSNGFVLNGASPGDQTGVSVSSAGDVNGDGFDDLIIGAYLADNQGSNSNEGASYLVFGAKNLGSSGRLELGDLNGSNGFILSGIDTDDRSGLSVSQAGDVNGDGFTDILIGAYGGDPNGNESGESYLVFGRDFTETVTHQGTDMDDVLIGDGGDNIIIGGLGNDVLQGNGGADVLLGGAGEDSLEITETSFMKLDGGLGTDTLVLNGSGLNLDLSTTADHFVTEIDIIDITGGNTLILDTLEVLNMSATRNQLTVLGNAGDSLNVTDGAWNDLGSSNGIHTYVSGQAELLVSDAITTNFSQKIRSNDIGINEADGTAIVTMERTGLLTDAVTVEVNTIDGSATVSGSDYLSHSGVVTFVPGLSEAFFTVTILDDTTVETAEYFEIELSNASSGTITEANYEAVIFNDDVTVELATALTGDLGFSLPGVGQGYLTGYSVSGVGDVNGDGFDDFIIGAYGIAGNTGGAYVVFGGIGIDSAGHFDLGSLNGSNGFAITGVISGGQAGDAVGAGGDINGDGWHDILISVPLSDVNGPNSGQVYVIFGATNVGSAGSIVLDDIDGTNGFAVNGMSGEKLTVADSGDFNGDGLSDLVIGAGSANGETGKAYVILGDSALGASGSFEVSNINHTNGLVLNGENIGDYFGGSVSSAGDFNGDGIEDFIIGADRADPYGRNYAGKAYVLFGDNDLTHLGLELSLLDGSNGFVLLGEAENDVAGVSVSTIGDINGDGFEDLLVGAAQDEDTLTFESGKAYVIFGHNNVASGTLDLTTLSASLFDPSIGFIIQGESDGLPDGVVASDPEAFGMSVNGLGDFNGDGLSDLIISAEGFNYDQGRAYILMGNSELGREGIPVQVSNIGSRVDGLVMVGEGKKNDSVLAVNTAGDVNGDGFDDVIIGTDAMAQGVGTDVGKAYIIYGGDFSGLVDDEIGNGGGIVVGTEGADVLLGGAGEDILISGAGEDVLRSGAGNDTLQIDNGVNLIDGGTGIDTLDILSDADILIDFTRIADHEITGIERINLDAAAHIDVEVVLQLTDVLNLSDTSNTVEILGSSGDTVKVADGTWTDQGSKGGFHTYSLGQATLVIEDDISTAIVI